MRHLPIKRVVSLAAGVLLGLWVLVLLIHMQGESQAALHAAARDRAQALVAYAARDMKRWLKEDKSSELERLARDLEAMAELPAAPFDACDQATGRVSLQALVRYKTNDYSVPVAYGHQDVWVRGYVNEVVIGCRGEIIARHPRCWEREDVVFDPVHYLPLIEQKINALDQAAPLQGWDLPEEFATLRRLMEGRMAKHGRREYVQVRIPS